MVRDERRRQQAVGRLTVGIAHELSTSVQCLGSNLRFLQGFQAEMGRILAFARTHRGGLPRDAAPAEIAWMEEEAPRALAESQENLEHIIAITQAMRRFSRPEAPEPGPVDVNACLEAAVLLARNEWKYTHRIRVVPDPDLPSIEAFPGALGLLLLDLVLGAVQARRVHRAAPGAFADLRISVAAREGGVEVRFEGPDLVPGRICSPVTASAAQRLGAIVRVEGGTFALRLPPRAC